MLKDSGTTPSGFVRLSTCIAGLAVAGVVATTAAPAQSVLAAESEPAAPRTEERSDMDRWLHRRLVELRRIGAVGVVAEIRTPAGVWRDAVGRSIRRPSKPARNGAEFRAASVTKSLTSVLALQLVEHGRWTLDTTIGDVLPRLWSARSDITLRQLLSHRSGMPDHVTGLLQKAETIAEFKRVIGRRYTDRRLVREAKQLLWEFEPGTDWAYSNTGYVIVGMMLKKATGSPLPKLMRNRVLRPAGMSQSRFGVSRRQYPPRLNEYARFGKRIHDLGRFHPSIFSAAGALVATAGDLNRFHSALSKGRLLGPELVRAMRSPVTPTGNGTGYGLGSYSLPDPCRPGRVVHGHDGATWGTLTWSFGGPAGRKRVTVAMTGRNLGAEAQDVPAMLDFVHDALARNCRGNAVRWPQFGHGAAERPFLS